jgi:streptogramin lyase
VGWINVAADAGTAFDGQHLFQIAEDRIQKIDPETGRVLATIPAPGGGGDSGLAWAEGTLWVGQYRDRKIHQVDPETGAVLRTLECNRFVTGVTGTVTLSQDRRGTARIGRVMQPLSRPAKRGRLGLGTGGAWGGR